MTNQKNIKMAKKYKTIIFILSMEYMSNIKIQVLRSRSNIKIMVSSSLKEVERAMHVYKGELTDGEVLFS